MCSRLVLTYANWVNIYQEDCNLLFEKLEHNSYSLKII